ncbi:MAG: hypothetical protein WA979_01105 [Pacificimonas sp.]
MTNRLSLTAMAALGLLTVTGTAAAQQPFGGLSQEGRSILAEAMTKQDAPGHDEDVRRARLKVLRLLSAEKLDIDEIAEAQERERELVMKDHARAQSRMRDAYEQLSRQDRQAFASAMALREARVRQRMKLAKDRMHMLDRMMAQQQRAAERRAGARNVSD